ncbi:MAG: alpha/beta fold hydrolase [Actinomycetota bacterium]|nr:alpha/beta fold hydrolase [Actinomycetota bacterium]
MTPARTPPELPGLNPDWSRVLYVKDHDDADIGVHVLDVGPRDGDLTVVCVHGNPTWSYLWRAVVASAPSNIRVLAVDQIGMGYSARSDFPRRLADRINDLEAIIRSAAITRRVVFMAHDWGGPVALGLAERLVDSPDFEVVGVVLTNTAVHQPEHRGAPVLIAAARLPGVLSGVTYRTRGFVRATTAISSMDRTSARALRAPYRAASDRRAIMDFVADIPLTEDHPTLATLNSVAGELEKLSQVPVLMVWGMKDPVFSARYLDDLRRRLPHALVQQYDDAGHLVLEDRPDAISGIWQWVQDVSGDRHASNARVSGSDPDLLRGLRARHDSKERAVTEPRGDGWLTVSWTLLDDRVRRLARGFAERGVKPGDRVALLVPPGADLLAVVYACWAIGAVIVVIDAANAPMALWRSLRAARVDHVVAIKRARPVVTALHVPGVVIWADELAQVAHAVPVTADEQSAATATGQSDAAVVFTSGATGPAKPVAYTRERIAATRDVLLNHYGFTASDVLVAAFAPWAVLGPLLGISSVIPQMDASRPGTLTADALSSAMEQAGGTVMWMSPAALRSVLSGARSGSSQRTRLAAAGANLSFLLIAGAPVSRRLLQDAMDLWPHADVRTPYGMTEILPATDVSAKEVLAEPADLGVLVGRALPGVDIAIAPVDTDGIPAEESVTTSGVLGEVVIRALHAKSRYDARAFVERQASRNPGWHRTGDIGELDAHGRLWIQGRLSHVITTAEGPLGPVPIEQRIELAVAKQGSTDSPDTLVAAVGVGPRGTQVLVIVCAPSHPDGSKPQLRLADAELTEHVRAIFPSASAVLWSSRMPVDIRHGAKVDRQRLALEASEFLAGRR